MKGRVRTWTVALVAGLLLAGCGSGSGEIEPQRTAPDSVELESEAFADGDTIPARFTCDGGGSVPPLTWTGLPEGTAQVAVTLTDPDAPGGTFVHWLAVFPAGEGPADASPTVEGRNDFDEVGYGAPCPPEGDDPHRYVFTAYAYGAELDLEPGFSSSELEDALGSDLLAQGRLAGTYGR